MKKVLFLTLLFVIVFNLKAQDSIPDFKYNIDDLKFWRYDYSKNETISEIIGNLELMRIEEIYNKDSSKKFFPYVKYNIFPISKLDSISKINSKINRGLGCCFPVCTTHLTNTKNFVFWASPNNIKSALECNGIDYILKNAQLILEPIKEHNYDSIEALISDLRISQIEK